MFGVIKEVYNKKWHIGDRGELRKCKESGGRIWKKT